MSSLGFDCRLCTRFVVRIIVSAVVAFFIVLTVPEGASAFSPHGTPQEVSYDYDVGTAFANRDAAKPAVAELGAARLEATVAPTALGPGHSYESSVSFVAPGSLVDELAAAGIKHDPANIVRIARDGSGRVVFLETGNSRAGLAHIVGEHADDFAARGVTVNQIPDLVTNAASQGRIVGYQGTGTGRPIYEVVFDGSTQRVAVTVGDNGFIVGANPG